MNTGLDVSTLALMVGGLVATGAVSGLIAGLFGVGGGLVIVPVLFFVLGLFDVSPDIATHIAVATSLATIIPTAISSMRAHDRRGNVDWNVLKLWAPAMVVGALAGGIASSVIPGAGMRGIFGIVAVLLALNLANPRPFVVGEKLPENPWTHRAMASVIGFVSSLMGIGGGSMSVPTMTAFSFPVHRAVGTSAALGFFIAVPGALGFVWSGWSIEGRPPLSLGYVSLIAAVIIAPVSYFIAPLGARLAHALNPRWLRFAFGAFLLLTGIRMLTA